MSEYHLRCGGYGGIGYYIVSDMYIAPFSRFTTCGSWEGHDILDHLVENDLDVLPDTIHADTQGQRAAKPWTANDTRIAGSRPFTST